MKRTLAYNRYPLVICALGLLLGGLHSLFQLHQTLRIPGLRPI